MSSPSRDVKDIFCEAREITSPGELKAFLDQACGADAHVRRQVEALLHAERQAGRFLGGYDPETTLPPETTVGEGPGAAVGRYKLLQELGHGGFGVVFLAEQSEPYRRVALKILKPGMDTKEIIARFAAEEAALALMEHPNIARVFDSGATPSGRPYFVMELVQGVPITEYCDLHNLTPDERLRLFIDVCRATQHAHQKGVIHRDLKPSNILVAVRDGTPVVKVIDFGIAKAVSQPLTNHTVVTGPRAVLGTPLYMSPEQAGIGPLGVDTRTDIYSLGVVLYELLTGVTPFDRKRLSSASPDEVCRIIREEEPARPSTKVGTLGDTATTVAQHRKTEPRRLSKLIKGDLDWIVMKAMEKDPTRRYDTAKDLAEDVQRYLDHQPVEASPPAPLYRLGKFVRRNRRAAMVTAATVLALSFGGAATWRIGAEMAGRVANEIKVRQLEELDRKIIPEIEKRKKEEDFSGAVELAKPWRSRFPDHVRLAELWHAVTVNWTVITSEPGARVSRKTYGVKNAPWEELGRTPLDRVPVARGFYHWKIEQEGHDAIEGCAGPEEVEIRRTLLPAGVTPAGMVRVTFQGPDGRVKYFFIDRCEVTNREYKEFVDAGGYRRSEFWLVPVMQDGKAIALDDALKTFVDSTGRPGPVGWANGTYPAGEDSLPVRGISWYEAAAYALFRGKTLPTIEQWTAAASVDLVTYIAPHSNMNSDGPAPVGSYQAPSQFGVYDVAGNVKEWCLNPTTRGHRVVCGGAWEDPIYMFDGKEFVDPVSRSPQLGLRCVQQSGSTAKRAEVVNEGAGTIEVPPALTSEQLERCRSAYRYDKQAAFRQTVVTDTAGQGNCVHQIVQIDAAYADERFTLHILLPKERSGPHQAVLYFPGTGTWKLDRFSLDNSDGAYALAIAATGRAVCYPVYKGTFERRVNRAALGPEQHGDLRIAQVKDVCRALDYIGTRPEVFDTANPVYVGFSWGAEIAPLVMGVEDRFSACILVAGGLSRNTWYPELEPKNYVRLLRKPVLMINGALDWTTFPLKESQLPLFGAISSDDKRHHVFPDSQHVPPLDETMAVIDAWLNKHFGPVGPPLPPEQRADQLVDRAKALLESKRFPQAEQLLKEAIKAYETERGRDHPKTLRASTRLAEAIVNQSRASEARPLLEETLKKQWAAFGKTHEDTLETRKVLASTYASLSLTMAVKRDNTSDAYQEAVRLAQRSLELSDLRNNQRHALALAQYRRGDFSDSAATLREVVCIESVGVYGWLLKAMVHKRLGADELAESWFAAATEWLNKNRTTTGSAIAVRDEAAGVLQLSVPWPPADWTDTQWIEQYDRLIQDQPDLARLYQCRGSHYGRMQRWPEAVRDYSKSSELRPDDWGYQGTLAATCLQTGQGERYKAACQSILTRLNTDSPFEPKAMVSMLCSLSNLPDFDRTALVQVAESALKAAPTNDWVRLAKGMTLYRHGQFEQALQTIPGESTTFANPVDALLCLLFRAMTHHRLGDAYTSRKLLEQARDGIGKQLAEPDGEELRFQDRPVAWCMVHVVLREAESLIEAAPEALPSVSDTQPGAQSQGSRE